MEEKWKLFHNLTTLQINDRRIYLLIYQKNTKMIPYLK